MMTPDEMIEVRQAYKNGKRIQVKVCGAWETIFLEPSWDFKKNTYRVAPQPEEHSVSVRLINCIVRLNDSAPSAIDNLKLTFIEGKLVGAEVINK